MGSQLRWLERTPDKREVDGSIPFEPTTRLSKKRKIIDSTLKNIQRKIGKLVKEESQERQRDNVKH